jgi:voltage-gated potassium channel
MMPSTSPEARRGRVRETARLLVFAVLLCVLYAFIPMQTGLWWIGLATGVVGLAAIVPVAIRSANAVTVADRPFRTAIEAIVLVVALLVFGFSSIFLAINHTEGQFVGLVTRVDAVYFTVTTMSTVGYGDIHAAGQAARVAVSIQIVFDLSFLALSIRLLTRAVRQRTLADQT